MAEALHVFASAFDRSGLEMTALSRQDLLEFAARHESARAARS
jgi:hypothetical protein